LIVVVVQLLVELALTRHREQITSNRKRYFLLPNTRRLEIQDEIVLRLVHVDDRHPDSAFRSGRGSQGTTEEAVEQSVHLALDVTEGLPSLHKRSKRTPTLDRHGRSSLLCDVASLPAGLKRIVMSAR